MKLEQTRLGIIIYQFQLYVSLHRSKAEADILLNLTALGCTRESRSRKEKAYKVAKRKSFFSTTKRLFQVRCSLILLFSLSTRMQCLQVLCSARCEERQSVMLTKGN